jgi:hypothetical protein
VRRDYNKIHSFLDIARLVALRQPQLNWLK